MAPDPRDLTKPHIAALEALLAAAGYDLYVTEVSAVDEDIAYPYLVLHPGNPTAEADTYAGTSGLARWRWQVTAVGRDVTETVSALDRARAALIDQRPTVTGRSYGMVTEVIVGQPVARDPSAVDPATRRPVFFGVALFEVPSVAT